MLEVGSGSEVLYVGYHMYGDMIGQVAGWRTTLMFPNSSLSWAGRAVGPALRHIVAEKEKECEEAELAVQELRLSFGAGFGFSRI